MKSLKLMLLLAGYPEKDMFSHESDLYVYKTELSSSVIREWCRENSYDISWNCPVFCDNITGWLMYDCAFQNYLPLEPWSGDGLVNKSIAADLLADDEGNVYYRSRTSGALNLWCSAERLSAHIHHLNQIEWRK